MSKVLLVEDEVHKREELTSCLEFFFGDRLQLTQADSVRSAFLAVSKETFSLIVLDMALPTFSSEGGGSERGYDQAFGGVEILRTLKSKGQMCKIIIITQYPEITIDGRRVKLNAAGSLLSKKYAQDVVGGIHYKYKSPSNHMKLTELLKRIK